MINMAFPKYKVNIYTKCDQINIPQKIMANEGQYNPKESSNMCQSISPKMLRNYELDPMSK